MGLIFWVAEPAAFENVQAKWTPILAFKTIKRVILYRKKVFWSVHYIKENSVADPDEFCPDLDLDPDP